MHAFLNTFISYTIGACQPPSSAPKQLASSGKLSTDYFDVDEHPKSRNSPTRQMPRMSLPQTPARKSAQRKKRRPEKIPLLGNRRYHHISTHCRTNCRLCVVLWSASRGGRDRNPSPTFSIRLPSGASSSFASCPSSIRRHPHRRPRACASSSSLTRALP